MSVDQVLKSEIMNAVNDRNFLGIQSLLETPQVTLEDFYDAIADVLNDIWLNEAYALKKGLLFYILVQFGTTEYIKRMFDDLGTFARAYAMTVSEGDWAPLHMVAQYGDAEAIQVVLDVLGESAVQVARMPNEDGWTPFHLAAAHADIEGIKCFTRLGLKVSEAMYVNEDGQRSEREITALTLMEENPDPSCVAYLKRHRIKQLYSICKTYDDSGMGLPDALFHEAVLLKADFVDYIKEQADTRSADSVNDALVFLDRYIPEDPEVPTNNLSRILCYQGGSDGAFDEKSENEADAKYFGETPEYNALKTTRKRLCPGITINSPIRSPNKNSTCLTRWSLGHASYEDTEESKLASPK